MDMQTGIVLVGAGIVMGALLGQLATKWWRGVVERELISLVVQLPATKPDGSTGLDHQVYLILKQRYRRYHAMVDEAFTTVFEQIADDKIAAERQLYALRACSNATEYELEMGQRQVESLEAEFAAHQTANTLFYEHVPAPRRVLPTASSH